MDSQTRHTDHRHATRSRGLTLLELLITLTIAVIIATVAIPALHTLIMSNRMSTQLSEWLTALQAARSHAISHQQHVVICPSADQNACVSSTVWQNGWITFADRNLNQQHDRDESLSRVNNTTLTDMSIMSSNGRQRIAFQADGSAGGSNTTLTFCDARGAAHARAIIIAVNGRPRLASARADGTALSCP
ncbi:MAG: GspH/FimT family pseudopilin [Gammaproteobacteria bacterium]